MRRLLGVLAAVLLLTGCTSADAGPPPVRVAAASDLRPVLGDLLAALPDVDVSYGSSGTLLRQVLDGAPFDVFLSADLGYAQQVAEAGRADAADVFPYARGRLALWAPDGSPVDPAGGLGALATARRVAIASPEHAPYGRAAAAALASAGVDVEGRLAVGESVAQALDLARTGGADAAVVALSLVLSPALAGQGRWAEVPPQAFPAVEQGGVVLARAQDRDAAVAVREALTGPGGRALLARSGFVPAG